jgi:CBS-domain-containing membrane protein
VNVSAGFDTIVAVVLLTALGLLLAIGVYRNVKRRRHPRAATS